MTRGIVAAGHDVTAAAAESILRDGGNAFDAVLGGLAAACVAEPVLASLGGGGFLLAQPAQGPARLYDFFAHTPCQAQAEADLDFRPILADFGTAQQEFHIGRGAVAVPGLVRGMFEVHRDLGSMPMREIVAPAVQSAAEGITINSLQAYIYDIVGVIYMDSPAARTIFESPERPGQLVGEGETLRQPELADLMEILAVEGADMFYRGEIAGAIVRDMQDGGHITLEDLEQYRVEKRHPLTVNYRGTRLMTNPPPSSGGLLIAFALELLREQSPAARRFGSSEHLALLARIMELATEARLDAHMDETAPHPDAGRLLAPEYVARYRRALGGGAVSRRGTTHISAMDGAGNVASLSTSNGEGSGYVVPGTGVMLNNMLGEQDLNPRGFHRWPTDTRMTSMMAPTIGLSPDGRRIATGSGGSNRIRSAILQVLTNIIDFQMDVEEAVGASRIHYEQGLLSIEGGFDAARLAPLLDVYPKHQLWQGRNLFFGGTHTVMAKGNEFSGAGDPRRGGVCVQVGL